jgi:hypothetical protein
MPKAKKNKKKDKNMSIKIINKTPALDSVFLPEQVILYILEILTDV